jgi:hypothetical protein
MTALAWTSSNCKWQNRPLVREGVPHDKTLKCLTVIRMWSRAPDGCLTPWQADRLTVGRNITLTLTFLTKRIESRESAVRSWEIVPSEIFADSRPWWRTGRRSSPTVVTRWVATLNILWDRRQPARTWSRKHRNVHCFRILPSSAVKTVTGNTSLS